MFVGAVVSLVVVSMPPTAMVLVGRAGLQPTEQKAIEAALEASVSGAWSVPESRQRLGERALAKCGTELTCLRGLASVAGASRLVVVEVTRVAGDRAWVLEALAVASGERLHHSEWVDQRGDPLAARLAPLDAALTVEDRPVEVALVPPPPPLITPIELPVATQSAAPPRVGRALTLSGAAVALAAAVALLVGAAIVNGEATAIQPGSGGLRLSPLTEAEARARAGTATGLGVGGAAAAAAAVGLTVTGVFAF